jgi:hypothetical protein
LEGSGDHNSLQNKTATEGVSTGETGENQESSHNKRRGERTQRYRVWRTWNHRSIFFCRFQLDQHRNWLELHPLFFFLPVEPKKARATEKKGVRISKNALSSTKENGTTRKLS